MNEQNRTEVSGIVYVKDPTNYDGQLIQLNSPDELEAFLKSEALSTVNLSRLLWDSLQDAFRIGKKVGYRKAQQNDTSAPRRF